MMQHFRLCHNSYCCKYLGEAAFAPIPRKHPKQWFEPRPPCSDTVENPCVNAFAGLALRQLTAKLPSIEDIAAYMTFFGRLLEYVALEGSCAKAVLRPSEWCRFIYIFLPKDLRRFCPRWWRSYPRLVLTRRYSGVGLLCERPLRTPVVEASSEAVASCRQACAQATDCARSAFVAAPAAADLAEEMCACARAAQLFFMDLAQGHDDQVVHSHGDHIPLAVRDCATYLWWLPELLSFDYSVLDASAQVHDSFWEARLEALGVVASHVSNQMHSFEWPECKRMEKQYKRLVRHWADIAKKPSISEKVWKDGIFQWEAWWRMSHTNQVSAGDIVQFVPAGLEAAWELFHFTGMLGTSEAAAESVGSILKRFANAGLSTGRVVESTILRWSGIRGDGRDDQVLSACWAKVFAGASPDKYTFDYRGRAGQKRARLWGGSKSNQRRLEEAARSAVRPRDLRLALRRGDATPGEPRGWNEWREALRTTREA